MEVALTPLEFARRTRALYPDREALVDGPDEEQVPTEIRVLVVERGAYRALLQVSEVEGRRYVDKGWRLP